MKFYITKNGEITTAKELIYICVKDTDFDNDGLLRQVSMRKIWTIVLHNRAAIEVDDIVFD